MACLKAKAIVKSGKIQILPFLSTPLHSKCGTQSKEQKKYMSTLDKWLFPSQEMTVELNIFGPYTTPGSGDGVSHLQQIANIIIIFTINTI